MNRHRCHSMNLQASIFDQSATKFGPFCQSARATKCLLWIIHRIPFEESEIWRIHPLRDKLMPKCNFITFIYLRLIQLDHSIITDDEITNNFFQRESRKAWTWLPVRESGHFSPEAKKHRNDSFATSARHWWRFNENLKTSFPLRTRHREVIQTW